jgi:hypothetical protein
MQDKKSPGSSIGRAKLWRCLGYKFKSCLGHILIDCIIGYFSFNNKA